MIEMIMKRAYIVYDKDHHDTRAAVIAESVTKAKMMVFDNFSDFLGGSWIDLRVKWIKDANINGLNIGDQIQQDEAVRRGIFDYIIG